MKKLFRSASTKVATPKGVDSVKEEGNADNPYPYDALAYHRPSLLKISPQAPALKNPSAPNSPTQAERNRQRSVHFGAFGIQQEKTYLEAQAYSHQQKFTINSGLYLHFEKPPTDHYKFLTTAESIHTRGTLRQLITSASTDDSSNAWDSITPLPLFAARYMNPGYTKEKKSIYWEIQIQSVGFSRFSSLDGTSTPISSYDDPAIDQLGLSRSISHQLHVNKSRSTGSKLAVGFISKCVTPDTVPFLRRNNSLRPVDEFEFPTCVSGTGVFWSSDNGGSVVIDGKKTRHSIPAGTGDTVGIGMTFEYVKPEEDETAVEEEAAAAPPPASPTTAEQRRKSSAGMLNIAGMDLADLKVVPTSLFIVVNDTCHQVASSTPSTNPFDITLPEYLSGIYDIFPCLIVQGAGVEIKTKLGEAVDWTGPGGKSEAHKSALGDRGSISAGGGKDGQANSGGMKKSKWWHKLGE